MQDDEIIKLYFGRDETAVRETEEKYGRYLTKIAYNILFDFEDSIEAVNETYFKAWSSIPPHRPASLSAYLGRITRQLSIDIFRAKRSEKRLPSDYAVSLEELGECVSGEGSVEDEAELKALGESIGKWLAGLSQDDRVVFVCRYFHADSIRDISSWLGMSESKIKSMLHRDRAKLRAYLKKEGFRV